MTAAGIDPLAQVPEERAAIGGIFRLVAGLALLWGTSPQFVLFVLAGEAPDEVRWGSLVGRAWDRLAPSARATIEALSTSGEEGSR